MVILAIRTDKPEAELYLYNKKEQVDSCMWQAHRELSSTLLVKIEEILEKNSLQKKDITAVLVFRGPGSFTGLRIGVAVANTLAYALNIPIAGGQGDDWLADIDQHLHGLRSYTNSVAPNYGSEAHITRPRK